MAELLFTTDVFRPLDRSVPGVPMLLGANMRLVEPACSWLMHVALVRGRTRSPQTWRAYGEALYDWWQTLEANGWAWDRVGYHEVAAYRDRMLTGPTPAPPSTSACALSRCSIAGAPPTALPISDLCRCPDARQASMARGRSPCWRLSCGGRAGKGEGPGIPAVCVKAAALMDISCNGLPNKP